MGRGILVEPSISDYVDDLFASTQRVAGLIIGQSTDQKDYVTHLAQTPPPSDTIQCEHTEQESKTPNKNIERRKSKEKKPTKAVVSEGIDEDWTSLHGKQVTRMLPGGWEILGVFYCSPDDTLPPATVTRLRQVLLSLYKLLEKHPKVYNGVDLTDRILLHISTNTRKLTCKTVDLTNSVSNPRPSDWKYQPLAVTRWTRIDCSLALNLPVPLSKGSARQPLIQQLRNGLSRFCESIERATVVFNNQMRNEVDVLVSQSAGGKEGKRGKHRGRTSMEEENGDQPSFIADLYVKQVPPSSAPKVSRDDCDVQIDVKGILHGRTFVHSKATVKEAIQAVKQDLIRSLLSRCEIHCEDLLLIDEERHDPWVVHEPPRRVFAPLPANPLTVSDYLFPGEEAQDSLSAFEELLDLHLSEDQVETQHERSAESSDLTVCSGSTMVAHKETPLEITPTTTKGRTHWNAIAVGLSMAVAAVGASLSYLMLQD